MILLVLGELDSCYKGGLMLITLAWSLGSAGCTSVVLNQRVTHVDDFSVQFFVDQDCKMSAEDTQELFTMRRCTGAETQGRRVVICMLSFPHHTCRRSQEICIE